jgi:ABC-type multidrug transport system fused ATPase/permease subunit
MTLLNNEGALEEAPYVYQKEGIRIGYCSQKPWILATTVKSNITIAGKISDEEDLVGANNLNLELYNKAVVSCNLLKDFQRYTFHYEKLVI